MALEGMVDAVGDIVGPEQGSLILGESHYKSDKVATLFCRATTSGASWAGDLEASLDGTNWIVAESVSDSDDPINAARISRRLHYRFIVTTAVSSGMLEVFLGG